MFSMRFDMRASEGGASHSDLYAAAFEMAAWAEKHGCTTITVCEHHGSDDGYLPSPMVMAGAIAARTESTLIAVAIVILPLYDPVRLAEEMLVLDHISQGRVLYVTAIGYRPEEYEMFGVDFGRRGAIAEENLELLLKAKTGEPFERDGRTIKVTPAPLTPGGPMVSYGGGSLVAARRAGRFGIGFMAQRSGAELEEAYQQASRDAGHEPGFCYLPPPNVPTTAFVAEDVDEAWDELGPYLLHDAQSYAAWNPGDTSTASLSFASSVDELRAENGSHRIFSVDEAVDMVRGGGGLGLHPLVGGVPPDIAWKYLRVVGETVVPALQA